MSYCRLGPESDIYIYWNGTTPSGERIFECCGCKLKETTIRLQGYLSLIEHIIDHERACHKVPKYLVPFIQDEEKNPPKSIVDQLQSENWKLGDPL